MTVTNTLRSIGLTANETKAYMALLELGESKTGEILKKAKLKTGKIYEILDALAQKGLISIVTKSGVKHFSPSDPKRVNDYLAEKKKEILLQQKDFQKILPQLMKKVNKVKSPSRIEIFYGFKGLKTAYAKEAARAKKGRTLYVMGVASSEEYEKQITDFFIYNQKPKREQSKVTIYKLLSKEARKYRKQHEKNAKIRYLPYSPMTGINIINELSIIGIFSKEPIFITIENKEVANSFIQQFKLLWKQAKE